MAIPADAQPVDAQGTIEVPDADVTAKAAEATFDSTSPEISSVQCFSCVQICNVNRGKAECSGREDLICGWGVHPENDLASRFAQSECDAALDVARESTRYARIEGSCPIATCQ